MKANQLGRAAILGAAFAFSACAGTGPRAETVASRRVTDSAPERRASLRAATPGLEADDERWSIEAAKERKQGGVASGTSDPTGATTALGAPGKSSVDVKAPPTPGGQP